MPLETLLPGTQLLVGGDQIVEIDPDLAAAFVPGDALCVVKETGQVLHIPKQQRDLAKTAVDRAMDAFAVMRSIGAEQITRFYEEFASRVEDDGIWTHIAAINREDVERAEAKGRSTTRLVADNGLRKKVIAGLRSWKDAESQRGNVLEVVQHDGWRAELTGAELGVVAFIFEGRPNVVADATGVLRGGNTVVFRIGSDALQTAKVILRLALHPALVAAGIPTGAVSLVDSAEHAAGWALFGDSRLSLAVARGSGRAVDTLGSIARSAGIAVSEHGTGGAWIVAASDASAETVEGVVAASLDRKVCNTLNTLCIPRESIETMVPAVLRGLQKAGAHLGQAYKLHVAAGDEFAVPEALFAKRVLIHRATGLVEENQAQSIPVDQLGREWEWEQSPEISLKIVESVAHAVELFNQYSPQFTACLLSPDRVKHEQFYRDVNAPFVGDSFSRWVDGQYALNRPELGLSNWGQGRLFARGGVLSGDSVYTVRTRYISEK